MVLSHLTLPSAPIAKGRLQPRLGGLAVGLPTSERAVAATCQVVEQADSKCVTQDLHRTSLHTFGIADKACLTPWLNRGNVALVHGLFGLARLANYISDGKKAHSDDHARQCNSRKLPLTLDSSGQTSWCEADGL